MDLHLIAMIPHYLCGVLIANPDLLVFIGLP